MLSMSFLSIAAPAQSLSSAQESNNSPTTTDSTAQVSEIEAIKRRVQEQQKQIEQLQLMLVQQSKIIEQMQTRSAPIIQTGAVSPSSNSDPVVAQTGQVDDRLTKLEEQAKRTMTAIERNQLGTLALSGDLRMQYDSFLRTAEQRSERR